MIKPVYKVYLMVVVTAFFFAGAYKLLTFSFFSEREERIVGITLKGVEVPCGEKVRGAGNCVAPDPSGTKLTLKIPSKMRGVDSIRKYEFQVRLSVLVTGNEVRPIVEYRDVRPLKNEESNYLNSGFIAVSAANEAESLADFTEQAISPWRTASRDYRAVTSDVKNTVLYDDVKCEVDDIKETSSRSCYARRKIYFSSGHPYAYASCAIPPVDARGKKSFACFVVSKASSSATIKYTIDGKYLLDGSWIAYDQRIRNYVLSLQVYGKRGQIY